MSGREANIALVSKTHESAFLSKSLAQADIAAGHGDFYARRLLESAGVNNTSDGVLRVSFAHYNTAKDVSRVVTALEAIH